MLLTNAMEMRDHVVNTDRWTNGFYNRLPHANGGLTKFAVCLSVCLSVCSGRISSESVERIWLK